MLRVKGQGFKGPEGCSRRGSRRGSRVQRFKGSRVLIGFKGSRVKGLKGEKVTGERVKG